MNSIIQCLCFLNSATRNQNISIFNPYPLNYQNHVFSYTSSLAFKSMASSYVSHHDPNHTTHRTSHVLLKNQSHWHFFTAQPEQDRTRLIAPAPPILASYLQLPISVKKLIPTYPSVSNPTPPPSLPTEATVNANAFFVNHQLNLISFPEKNHHHYTTSFDGL